MADAALLAMRCQPLEGQPALTAAEAAALLPRVPGWAIDGASITKTYAFPDFHRTMAFVNAVAWIAHVEDHHPSLSVSYARCALRFDTHSVGGLSINDFVCAAKVDALLEGDAAPAAG
jgi:4a-hydroxytetrahydrobiopterin dehydratase